jgi:SAM-dependent methyltransferase
VNYTNYERWKRWELDSFGTWSELDAAYFEAELVRAGIDSKDKPRLLEIGFGNGGFAGYVLSKGADYFGTELNVTLIERARQFGYSVFPGSIKDATDAIGRGTVDAIVAFDVLEHLDTEAIRALLDDALQLLKPGGVFLARVPSGDSPFGRAIFHGDLTHITALGSAAVEQLALQTGYEVLDVGPPCLPLFGVGLVRFIRRLLLRLSQQIITRFVNLLFHDGHPRVITANLVFVLKKPKN